MDQISNENVNFCIKIDRFYKIKNSQFEKFINQMNIVFQK